VHTRKKLKAINGSVFFSLSGKPDQGQGGGRDNPEKEFEWDTRTRVFWYHFPFLTFLSFPMADAQWQPARQIQNTRVSSFGFFGKRKGVVLV